MISNTLVVGGFILAAVGGWISYLNGGSLIVAIALTMFVIGNTLLVLK